MSERDQQAPALPAWTRRALLKAAGVGAVTLALPEAALGRKLKPLVRHQDHLRRSSYRGLIGAHFRVEGSQLLKLTGVEDLNSAQAGSETAFALVFSGPPTLAHAVPELQHPRFGSFRLLLSPGPATAQHGSYVAVINQLAPVRG